MLAPAPVVTEQETIVKDKKADEKWYTLTNEDMQLLVVLSEKGDIQAIDRLYEKIIHQ